MDRQAVAATARAAGVPFAPEVEWQPIVDLRTGQAVGHEALLRPPFGGPGPLFLRLGREGNAALLDTAVLALALADPPPAGLLFLNLSPDALDAILLGWRPPVLPPPERAVWEISERHAAAESARTARLVAVRLHRVLPGALALDDAQTPQVIAALRPAWVKADRTLVHGIASSPPRQSMFLRLLEAAKAAGARVVAEGIELSEDLEWAAAAGADAAQGFVFRRAGR